MIHSLEIRPHGANDRRAFLPARTMPEALNLFRIFGGAIIDVATGIDFTPKPE